MNVTNFICTCFKELMQLLLLIRSPSVNALLILLILSSRVTRINSYKLVSDVYRY